MLVSFGALCVNPTLTGCHREPRKLRRICSVAPTASSTLCLVSTGSPTSSEIRRVASPLTSFNRMRNDSLYVCSYRINTSSALLTSGSSLMTKLRGPRLDSRRRPASRSPKSSCPDSAADRSRSDAMEAAGTHWSGFARLAGLRPTLLMRPQRPRPLFGTGRRIGSVTRSGRVAS